MKNLNSAGRILGSALLSPFWVAGRLMRLFFTAATLTAGAFREGLDDEAEHSTNPHTALLIMLLLIWSLVISLRVW